MLKVWKSPMLAAQTIFCQVSRKLSKIPFLCTLMKFVSFNNESSHVYHFAKVLQHFFVPTIYLKNCIFHKFYPSKCQQVFLNICPWKLKWILDFCITIKIHFQVSQYRFSVGFSVPVIHHETAFYTFFFSNSKYPLHRVFAHTIPRWHQRHGRRPFASHVRSIKEFHRRYF